MTRQADPVSAAVKATAERWWDVCSAGPDGHVAALIALRDAINAELAARGCDAVAADAAIRASALRDAATALELITKRASAMLAETAASRLTERLARSHATWLRECADEMDRGGDPFADAAGGAS